MWRNPKTKNMRKILLLTTILFTQLAFSQVVDVFNYTGALNANGWTMHSGTAGQFSSTITTSLTYSGLASSTGGKAAFVSGNSEDLNKAITIIGDTAFVSFLYSLPSTTGLTSGDYFTGIGGTAGSSMSSLFARTYVKPGTAANTVNFGIGNSSGTATYSVTDYAINTTILLVIGLDKSVTPHVAKLYVNPTPGATAPAATVSNTVSSSVIPAFACVYLRQGSGTGNGEIDEIRAGSTFSSVTPSSATGCNIAASGITALSCNDASTAANPADDYLTFSLNPTGSTLGASYTVSVPTGTITPTTGTYGAATSFQLQAGSAGAGNVTVTITDVAAGSCTLNQLITDPGACSSANPVITLAPSLLTAFNHVVGTPSAEQTFTASGLGMIGGITITAPTNFEISLTTGAGFTNSLILPQTGGTVSNTTIYVIANAAVAGSLAGDILATSNGAANDSVNVSGIANDYVYYTIDQISTVDANGVADSLDVLVELTGVLYCIDFDGNTGYSLTMIDGSDSGINLFSFSDVSGYTTAAEGDSLRVFGKIAQYNGLLEVVADSIEVLAQGVALMAPTVVTILDESTESQYITMKNLSLVTPMATFGTGSANIDVTDGVNTFVIRIDSDTDIPGAAAPQGLFNVTGTGGQFDNSSPYDSGYQLFPCSIASFVDTCNPPSSAITSTSNTATATAAGTSISYQWIDCANNTPISGETSQTFTALITGNYAVIVSEGTCSITSTCVLLNGTSGIVENELLNSVSVYPNPINDILNINNSSNEVLTFEIVDINGRTISSTKSVATSTSISTSTWNKGVYFIRFTSEAGQAVMKVVK